MRHCGKILVCLLVGFVVGCPPPDEGAEEDRPAVGPGDGGAEHEPVFRIATVRDADTDVATVMASEDDEKVVVLADKNADGSVAHVTGGSYEGSDGSTLTFWFNEDGLPGVVVSDGWVCTLTNYTSSTVDILAKAPDGHLYQFLGVAIDSETAAELRQVGSTGSIGQSSKTISVLKPALPPAQSASSLSTPDALRAVSLGLSIGCCAVGVATSPTGVGAVVAVACCTGSILGTAAAITDDDLLGAGAVATETFTCALGDPGGCFGLGLDVTAEILEGAEQTVSERINVAGTWVVTSNIGELPAHMSLQFDSNGRLLSWTIDETKRSLEAQFGGVVTIHNTLFPANRYTLWFEVDQYGDARRIYLKPGSDPILLDSRTRVVSWTDRTSVRGTLGTMEEEQINELSFSGYLSPDDNTITWANVSGTITVQSLGETYTYDVTEDDFEDPELTWTKL